MADTPTVFSFMYMYLYNVHAVFNLLIVMIVIDVVQNIVLH